MSASLSSVQQCRALAQALTVRAMLRVGEGRYEDAWQDLLACHRLGRLVARGGTLMEGLVGYAIDRMAGDADLAFLERAAVNGKAVKDYLRELERLPPVPGVVDKMELADRITFLEAVMGVARYGANYFEGLTSTTSPKPSQTSRDPALDRVLEKTDWDPALEGANRWFDRIAAALRENDRPTRERQLEQIVADLKTLRKEVVETGGLGLLRGNKESGKVLGDLLIAYMMPAFHNVQQAFDRTEQMQLNVHIAFALAAYQREHGRYPRSLDALVPRYLQRVPGDLFSGKALTYRPSGKGYLLYSVGINGRDDGGRGEEANPPGDDLSVRMPLPPLARRP
jgi:hypothetical protein